MDPAGENPARVLVSDRQQSGFRGGDQAHVGRLAGGLRRVAVGAANQCPDRLRGTEKPQIRAGVSKHDVGRLGERAIHVRSKHRSGIGRVGVHFGPDARLAGIRVLGVKPNFPRKIGAHTEPAVARNDGIHVSVVGVFESNSDGPAVFRDGDPLRGRDRDVPVVVLKGPAVQNDRVRDELFGDRAQKTSIPVSGNARTNDSFFNRETAREGLRRGGQIQTRARRTVRNDANVSREERNVLRRVRVVGQRDVRNRFGRVRDFARVFAAGDFIGRNGHGPAVEVHRAFTHIQTTKRDRGFRSVGKVQRARGQREGPERERAGIRENLRAGAADPDGRGRGEFSLVLERLPVRDVNIQRAAADDVRGRVPVEARHGIGLSVELDLRAAGVLV